MVCYYEIKMVDVKLVYFFEVRDKENNVVYGVWFGGCIFVGVNFICGMVFLGIG